MSNRFVSGGTINTSGDASEATDAIPRSQLGQNTEWEAVQRELENDRKRREEQRLKSATGEERSLYDVLQANKGLLTCLNFLSYYFVFFFFFFLLHRLCGTV